MSSGNHYILYFTASAYQKSSHYGEIAVKNLRESVWAREGGIRPEEGTDRKPSPEPMPGVGQRQGAGMVHSLWSGVEGVDKAASGWNSIPVACPCAPAMYWCLPPAPFGAGISISLAAAGAAAASFRVGDPGHGGVDSRLRAAARLPHQKHRETGPARRGSRPPFLLSENSPMRAPHVPAGRASPESEIRGPRFALGIPVISRPSRRRPRELCAPTSSTPGPGRSRRPTSRRPARRRNARPYAGPVRGEH